MNHPNKDRVNAKLSYGRSPIKIQSLCKDFNGLKPITTSSPLIMNNVFEVDSGKKWYDIIQFADSFHFAISERIRNILEENHITGWDSIPIKIRGYPDKEYHVFYVDSVAGRLTNLEELNNYETEIHEFDLSSWNRTDFFTHEETL